VPAVGVLPGQPAGVPNTNRRRRHHPVAIGPSSSQRRATPQTRKGQQAITNAFVRASQQHPHAGAIVHLADNIDSPLITAHLLHYAFPSEVPKPTQPLEDHHVQQVIGHLQHALRQTSSPEAIVSKSTHLAHLAEAHPHAIVRGNPRLSNAVKQTATEATRLPSGYSKVNVKAKGELAGTGVGRTLSAQEKAPTSPSAKQQARISRKGFGVSAGERAGAAALMELAPGVAAIENPTPANIAIGAATVRVSLGIDAATLMTVLRAVKAAT